MTDLLIVERTRPVDPDDDSPAAYARHYAGLGRLRGRSGQSLLVDGGGQILTPAPFHDADASVAASGRTVVSRRLSHEALGKPAGSDYAAVHAPDLAADEDGPWSGVTVTYRPQPMVLSSVADRECAPRSALFATSSVAISADGTTLALLEFRGRGGDGDPYRLVIEDVETGRQLAALAPPAGQAWDFTRLEFDPSAAWIMISPEANPEGPLLIDWCHDRWVQLPAWLDSVAWNPIAGPGHLIGTTVREGHLTIGDFDLGTSSWRAIGTPGGALSQADYLVSLAINRAGTQLVGIGPLAEHERVRPGGGSGGHAAIVDLGTGVAARPLPVTFADGVERDHHRVMWAESHLPGDGFRPDGQWEFEPARHARELTPEQQDSHRTRFGLTTRDLVLAAAEGRASITLLAPPVRALAVAGHDIAPELTVGAIAVCGHRLSQPGQLEDAQVWAHLVDDLRALRSGAGPVLGFPVTVPAAPEDPAGYLAGQVLELARQRQEPVTGKTIVEVSMQGLLEPGTALHAASSAMEYEAARLAVVRLLEQEGLGHLITEDLRRPQPARRKLTYGDRVATVIPFNVAGAPYPKGSTGVIVQPSDPAQARSFAEADQHAVLFDNRGLVAVDDVFLERAD